MDAQSWNELAWNFLRSGQAELALEHARRAHEMSRSNVEYLNTLGVAYGETGQLELAEATFRKALKRKPAFVDALVNLAKSLEKQEKLPEARKAFERALAIDPRFPKLATNLAKVCRECGDAARARSLLLELEKSGGEDLAIALAACDLELGDAPRAIERLRAAVREHADWTLARDALAHLALSSGHWREGWNEYLGRHSLFGAQNSFQGSLPPRLDGRRVLLRGEQGIGDVLFFLRFAPLLRERGALLTLACEKKLHSLLEGNALLEEVREARPDDAANPRFDSRLWAGDLPALLECSDTPPAWRLSVGEGEQKNARRRLAALGPAPYLAGTWRAGTDIARGREFGPERAALTKSVPPALLGAALRGWPGTAVLLQRAARAQDGAEFAAGFAAPFHDLSFLGDDLRALLAVLCVLDEYVTVSNTNVHLLAGIGKTARVLLPFPAEWRWMHGDGPSPWFPDFTLYRQPVSRDWSAPLARLRTDLLR
jgi:Flp pilus assembly protein TadD